MRPSALPLRHDCCDYSGRPIGGAKPKGKFSRMPEVAPRTLTLPHAVFLERATNEPPTSAAVRLGQGAFLVLRLAERQMRDADWIATALRVGRVNRKMHRFDEAEHWYTGAGERAVRVGDAYSVLLGRLGYANILFFRGNLADCERTYREILADAQRERSVEAEARAQHGLGAALAGRGQPADAVPHLW